MGCLVGVWLLLLLRVPGERLIPKICLFPPGLIASGFVNGKITSSLALAGGESSRLIQYLRKLHCRAQEAGGRNRLPVSLSAAGDNLCRRRLESVELTTKTSPVPWEPAKHGIFSLLPRFGISRWLGECWALCRCSAEGGSGALRLRGVGWAHSMGIPLPFQPFHGCWRANGTCWLLPLHLPDFGCWRWARQLRERHPRKAFNPGLLRHDQIHGLGHTRE